eukprot:12772042-Prorocentrum_lima.AAC.1
MVGILRSQLQVPHQDNDGESAGECRRAMGRNITSIQANISHEALTLLGHFIQSPYYVHAFQ